MTDPLDEWGPQLSGRMIAVELLIHFLLSQKANRRQILAAATKQLEDIEAGIMRGATDAQRESAFAIFATARASLDKFTAEANRPRDR